MKKSLKYTLTTLISLLLVLIVLLVGYVIFLLVNYYRIEDNLDLSISNNQEKIIKIDEEYTALTYNIGFGAYDQDFSFFMDYGTMEDETLIHGSYGTAISKDAVNTNTQGSISIISEEETDFIILQEVDVKSTRSYNVNQYQEICDAFPSYSNIFATNFHSVFLFYPFHDSHGSVEAGLLTLSQYNVESAVRRSYPVTENLVEKLFDLDRSFIVSRYNIENSDKEFVLINSHMSAYDKGGIIREQQLKLLNEVMKSEYDKGNYVIAGGDFNHILGDNVGNFPNKQLVPEWIAQLTNNDLMSGLSIAEAINQAEVPTCRSADIPYEKGINYTSVIDGFLISDNIVAIVENLDKDFLYSDHNPVKITFTLK